MLKQRAQDKLDQVNRRINRKLDKSSITKPTSGDDFDILSDIANDWAACLFQQEVHGRARKGSVKTVDERPSTVLCERAQMALEVWILEELDIGTPVKTLFDWARIEGEGIKEDV